MLDVSDKDVDVMVKEINDILANGAPWTDEFRAKANAAIESKDATALRKVIGSSILKGFID
jgi:hypothetical protein